jgi:5-methylcytosine-specific restriction endonuclease McrA
LTREELLRAGPGRKGRRRKWIAAAVRWRVMKRDGFRCVACGKSPATHKGVDLEVDHVRPVSRGGGDQEGNLRTLCFACNRGKGKAA